ncbi:hypothetical protein C8Q73DRAFT_807308 [Cubamyces lactineus]|nr:hypothetical protein C8Q73DRAFT_807308 [Cubamyces lactineus]
MLLKAAKARLTTIAKKIGGQLSQHPNEELRMHPQALDELPFEILEYIFRLACADGGRTACSLSLVSKRIRAISRSTRFESVSLCSGVISQLDGFATAFERACKEAAEQHAPRPCVRHMAIVMAVDIQRYPERQHRVSVWLPPGSSTYHGTYLLAKEYHEELARLFQRMSTADLLSLLLLGCDTTTHPVEYCPMCQPICCPCGFPKLRELSMSRGGILPFVQSTDEGDHGAPEQSSVSQPLYPALKAFYLWLVPDAEVDFEHWATHTPQLETMDISVRCHVRQDIVFLPGLLSVLAKTRFDSSSGMPKSKPLWPELKQVTFAYLAKLFRHQLPADREAYVRFIGELDDFKANVLPATRLMEFAPSYRLRDEPHANAAVSDSVDSWEAARGYAFTYVNWVIRSRGNSGMATPEYGSDFWAPESMLHERQGSHALMDVAKKLWSVFRRDSRDARSGIVWGQ